LEKWSLFSLQVCNDYKVTKYTKRGEKMTLTLQEKMQKVYFQRNGLIAPDIAKGIEILKFEPAKGDSLWCELCGRFIRFDQEYVFAKADDIIPQYFHLKCRPYWLVDEQDEDLIAKCLDCKYASQIPRRSEQPEIGERKYYNFCSLPRHKNCPGSGGLGSMI